MYSQLIKIISCDRSNTIFTLTSLISNTKESTKTMKSFVSLDLLFLILLTRQLPNNNAWQQEETYYSQ